MGDELGPSTSAASISPRAFEEPPPPPPPHVPLAIRWPTLVFGLLLPMSLGVVFFARAQVGERSHLSRSARAELLECVAEARAADPAAGGRVSVRIVERNGVIVADALITARGERTPACLGRLKLRGAAVGPAGLQATFETDRWLGPDDGPSPAYVAAAIIPRREAIERCLGPGGFLAADVAADGALVNLVAGSHTRTAEAAAACVAPRLEGLGLPASKWGRREVTLVARASAH
jgi:hypothetical protein